MAESIVSAVMVKLLQFLSESAVEEIAPYFGGRGQMKKLNRIMWMIQARLLDAERLREGEDGAVIKEWLKRLKHVVHRLQDLFKEVTMADKENDQRPGGRLTKPFRFLFSRSSPIKMNKRIAQEAKAIMNELDDVAACMLSLNLRVHAIENQPAANLTKTRQTQSFVLEAEVIGRDDDKMAIIERIMNSDDVEGNVSVIPIVGIGGLGKTTLAQLVFNDENVQKHFELKSWACISEISCLEELTSKILKSIVEEDYRHLSLQQLQSRLREAINGKKYLLVLDDIWDEDRERWLPLKSFLCGGKRGSTIIITTRSRVVAENMGTVQPYELGGLPEGQSWKLFRNLAFKEGQEERDPHLTIIGKEIVKKCANVPLAIRTIAGLLYSQDTVQEWESFRDAELRMMEQQENSVMSTLKLSYIHLTPQLQQCFAYCTLFPKDYEINKQNLIYCWMAQGFIEPMDGSLQNPEDIGHGYFMELLRRCFFQDAKRNVYGDIIWCKMHDLMHDLATNVAGDEYLLAHRSIHHIKDDIRHVSIIADASWAPSGLLAARQLRSLLFLPSDAYWFSILKTNRLFSSFRYMRALDLSTVMCESLPDSIEELKHLRYLRLCPAVIVPDCITRLQNLYTLDLRPCYWLKELPRSFNKLTSLRHLHFHVQSYQLTDLPPRFGQLTSLQRLDKFVAGESNGLDALASLSNLVGELEIYFVKHRKNAVCEAKIANLKAKKLLDLVLRWSLSYEDPTTLVEEEEDIMMLDCLQPPSTLKRLQITDWIGGRFPRWGIYQFPCLLPNLVSVCIQFCRRCQHLPSFGKLPHLRFLELAYLEVLEYMETDANDISAAASGGFFPSLECLDLRHLHELKGWSKLEVGDDDIVQERYDKNHQYLRQWEFFPRLSQLCIYHCPKLMSMPLVPRLESLKADDIHGKLLKHLLHAEDSPIKATQDSQPTSTSSTLKKLDIESIQGLESFIINLSSLDSLTIKGCHQLIKLSTESPNSLRKLVISECGTLRDISGALQHLFVLEELNLWHCEELDLWDGEEEDDGGRKSRNTSNTSRQAAWEGLKSLRSLSLYTLSKLESLPQDLGCLTTLQELYIDGLTQLRGLPECIGYLTQLRQLSVRHCHKLMALPESFQNLTALQELNIRDCPDLDRRLERKDGDDWPPIPSTVSISRY